MCASSSTTRIFEVTAIPSIDHPAVSALSGLRDRNVNSPRGLTSPPCGEVGAGAKRPCRVGGPSSPHLVGRSARARSALPGGGPHLPTLWGGRRGREAPLPGRGTLTSPPCGEVGSGATRPCRVGAPTSLYPPAEDRKSTRLNSSHITISYAVFCLKKKTD